MRALVGISFVTVLAIVAWSVGQPSAKRIALRPSIRSVS